MGILDRLAAVDCVAYDPRWAPRHGWHDEHVQHDGKPDYLPAIMQVSAEFITLAMVLVDHDLIDGRFLQLGVGECPASHALWCALFKGGGVTLDLNGFYEGDVVTAGGDTHDPAMRELIGQRGPFDFLFIDAGHDYADVEADYRDYGPMVRPGGIIAFHDALFRRAYPEVEVWQFLQTLDNVVHIAMSDVGVAYVVKE